jgi:hypothetical protein
MSKMDQRQAMCYLIAYGMALTYATAGMVAAIVIAYQLR